MTIFSAVEDNLGRPLNRAERRSYLSRVKKENAAFPKYLVPVDIPEKYRGDAKFPVEAWRSRQFLVQVFDKGGDMIRMSVNRTDANLGERWADKITWDELQTLKREIGRGELEGFEVYPADSEIVNDANMRHLWIFKGNKKLPFGFHQDRRSPEAQATI